MNDGLELDDDLHERIKQLCSIGDALMETSEYPAAIDRYREVFVLLPEPIHQ